MDGMHNEAKNKYTPLAYLRQNPKEDVRQDFAACIDACGAKSGCVAVDYNQDTKSCGYINQLMVCATKPPLPQAPRKHRTVYSSRRIILIN